MNVIDSSGWLEYFANGPNAEFFATPVLDTTQLVVPTLSLYEVFKRIMQQSTLRDALKGVALMRQGRVVDLDETIALHAATLSIEFDLPLADSVMLATSRAFGAVLWTQDADFASIPGVKYRPK